MHFRDSAQRAAVCRALCAPLAASPPLWDDQGPTGRAEGLLEQDGGPLSAGERVLLLAAWAVWNADRSLALADLHRLSDAHLERLGSLLVAASRNADAVDLWLRRYTTGTGEP